MLLLPRGCVHSRYSPKGGNVPVMPSCGLQDSKHSDMYSISDMQGLRGLGATEEVGVNDSLAADI